MSGIDSLSCVITTFHRGDRLRRALDSAWNAGLRRVSVCAPAPDDATRETLALCREHDWLSFDIATTTEDIGCNATWMVAAYRAQTKRILTLHDDDSIHPDFGKVYEDVISVALDKRDAGFASWDAEVKYDDGRTEPCLYWQGTTPLVVKSSRLLGHLQSCLTHSPVISVLNRTVTIQALKEAAETLIGNDSLDGPGQTLGSELLVYYRHVDRFKRWLHVPRVLSYYGSHEGSGTIRADKANEIGRLRRGYDLARARSLCPAPIPRPRLLLVHSVYTPKDEAVRKRQQVAQESWAWHFNNVDMIDLPYVAPKMPTIRNVLDYACQFALPEDIVVYANADAGLTTHAVERIIAGVERGRGVTSCGHRQLDPQPGRLYKNLTYLKFPGGDGGRRHDAGLVGRAPGKDAGHVHRARGVGYGVQRLGGGLGGRAGRRNLPGGRMARLAGAHGQCVLASVALQRMAARFAWAEGPGG